MFPASFRVLCSTALTALTLAFSPLTHASGLQVSPVSLQITSNQNADGIWLTNVSTTPMHAQIRVFEWSQKDGEDMLAPSTGLMVSPPLLQIEPGAKQLVRVLRTGAPPAIGVESTYRLIIDELPPEVSAADNAEATPRETPPAGRSAFAMTFLMRFSVPVYVGNASDENLSDAVSTVNWTLERGAKTWTLRARNAGNVRAQVADLQGVTKNGKTVSLSEGLLGYVLAGSDMHWSFPAPAQGSSITGYQAMINSKVRSINVSGSQ